MSTIFKSSAGRIDYIDVFRAFGIILMLMGHIKFGGHSRKFIYAFHMPMFFIISGMFFSLKDNTSTFIKKKAKTLLIPYFVFGIFHYVIWLVQS